MGWIAIWPVLAFGSVNVQATPQETLADSVRFAAEDLASQPIHLRPYLRYLWAGNMPNQDWRQGLSLHVNQMSRDPDIYVPRILPCGTVAVVNLLDYGPIWTQELWEKLAEEEPYYRIRATVEKTVTEKDNRGRETKRIVKETRLVIAPWVIPTPEHKEALAVLIDGPMSKDGKRTGGTGSQAPVVRVDWFMWQTLIQADRKVGYFDFLGIKNEKDFDELVGFDANILKKFPRELRDGVSNSTVATQKARRVDGRGAALGWYFTTDDVKEPVGLSNPLVILDDRLIYDGRESLGNMPNGLMAAGIFQGNRVKEKAGLRVDSVPDFLARDNTAPPHSNDMRVNAILGCLRCHCPGEHDGMNPVRGFIRNSHQKPWGLQSPDFGTQKILNRIYFGDMEDALEENRRIYRKSVGKATGLKVSQAISILAKIFEDYDRPVTVDVAAAELGVSKEYFQALVRKRAEKPVVDAISANFGVQEPTPEQLKQNPDLPRPQPIPRRTWHELHTVAATMVHQSKLGEQK